MIITMEINSCSVFYCKFSEINKSTLVINNFEMGDILCLLFFSIYEYMKMWVLIGCIHLQIVCLFVTHSSRFRLFLPFSSANNRFCWLRACDFLKLASWWKNSNVALHFRGLLTESRNSEMKEPMNHGAEENKKNYGDK